MISARHTTNRQSFKKVTCPFKKLCMFEQITSDVMVLIVVFVQMHDTDGNDKLDGCELVKSLIHWHGEKRELIQFVLF